MKEELIKILEKAIFDLRSSENRTYRPVSAEAQGALDVMRGLLFGLERTDY